MKFRYEFLPKLLEISQGYETKKNNIKMDEMMKEKLFLLCKVLRTKQLVLMRDKVISSDEQTLTIIDLVLLRYVYITNSFLNTYSITRYVESAYRYANNF